MAHTMYEPTHKRAPHTVKMSAGDAVNTAKCVGCTRTGAILFAATYCPRHEPTAYASHMARHATDSIGPED